MKMRKLLHRGENMPNQNDISDVLKNSISKKKDFLYTLKYIKKFRKDNDFKEACSALDKNSIKNISLWMRIFSFILKDLFIALELIKVRNEIFNMMFNTFKPDLDKNELERLIESKGNYWLDKDYIKIQILSDFCDEFFKNSLLCENTSLLIKSTGESESEARDKYFAKRNLVLNVFKEVVENTRECHHQQILWQIKRESSQMGKLYISPFEGNTMVDKYNNAINDSSLLQE